jgi:hypothetical protein
VKVWITRYALTSGVFTAEVEEPSARAKDMIVVVNTAIGLKKYFDGECRDWHRTAGEARQRCQELRAAKIRSLQKQLDKLSMMTFDIEDRA